MNDIEQQLIDTIRKAVEDGDHELYKTSLDELNKLANCEELLSKMLVNLNTVDEFYILRTVVNMQNENPNT